MKKLYLFLILCSFGLGAYAGTIDPNSPDSAHLEYGSQFIHTVKICGTTEKDQYYFGSGVLYKKNIVITAAHILDHTKTRYIKFKDKSFQIKKAIQHHKYISDVFGYYDIGICVLEESIELEWYPELYRNNDEVSKICSISGYGACGTFVTGITRSDEKLRAGSNKIDGVDRGLLVCSPSKNNRTELEFCIAEGDSGGGLFIGNLLAGINSCVIHDKGQVRSTYGTQSGHTRISDHIEWIQNTVKTYEVK